MVGRMILIKSVAQTLSNYTMQIFFIPKCLLAKLEQKMKIFFWGFKEDKAHNLHYKAWRDVCKPKVEGGIGFIKLYAMNKAFVTKLAWNVSTQTDKTWVKLIRAKHLRGRRLLDIEHTRHVSSWIWGGIRSCLSTIDVGLCYQVCQNSSLDIRQDIWLPQFQNHRLPANLNVPPELVYVWDIYGAKWNTMGLSNSQANLPQPHCREDLKFSSLEHGERQTHMVPLFDRDVHH